MNFNGYEVIDYEVKKHKLRSAKNLRQTGIKIIITLNLLFVGITLTGQSKIVFDRYLLGQDVGFICSEDSLQTERMLQWTINGFTFKSTTDVVTIYPHEKEMDTIFFQETICSKTKYDTIFSRIPNRQELVMTIGCCDEKFDIVRKEDYEKRSQLFLTDPSLDFDSLDMTRLEFGTIKFEISNKPISDTLICVYAGEFTVGQMITKEKDYGWVKPCKVGYIDNIIKIYIIKLNANINYEIFGDKDKIICAEGIDIVAWNEKEWQDLEILKRFGLRLFNNEKVIIKYDYFTGEINLQIMQ